MQLDGDNPFLSAVQSPVRYWLAVFRQIKQLRIVPQRMIATG
jgi:hypothetical protein